MNDRFKFRATFSVSYYDENGNDKDIKLTVDDVAVYSGGEIGFSAQQIERVINALKLSEIEQDTIWQFINDNYATSSYEWFVCDNAIIEQCTGLKDKNSKQIYENDRVGFYVYGYDDEWHAQQGTVIWYNSCWGIETSSRFIQFENELIMKNPKDIEIIGNIYEQKEQQ